MTKTSKIKNLRNSTLPFRGVHLDVTKLKTKAKGIFRSRLTKAKQTFSLGYHETAEDAALAFNKKAKSLFMSEKAAKAAGYWNTI